MNNNANQFQITVNQYPHLAIHGARVGTPFCDGSYTYNIEVTSNEFHVNTSKSIAPREIQNFIDEVRRMQDASWDAPLSKAHLRSAVVHDFNLLIEGNGMYFEVAFHLRHGNENGWTVEFSMRSQPGKVAVEFNDSTG